MTNKTIAVKIAELIHLLDEETACCGENPRFYNEIAKELARLNPYGLDKLFDVVNRAKVIKEMS